MVYMTINIEVNFKYKHTTCAHTYIKEINSLTALLKLLIMKVLDFADICYIFWEVLWSALPFV